MIRVLHDVRRLLRPSPAAAAGMVVLAFVVVGSVAGGVRARATLLETRARTYARLALADLELRLSPTPKGVLAGLELPPGVIDAEERAQGLGRLTGGSARDLPTLVRLLPAAGPPRIDRLEIEPGGRYPAPGEKALVVDRSLRDLHGVSIGDRVLLTVDGETRTLPVVGVALSPEHIFAPSHPSYGLVVRGTAGVVGISEAGAAGLPHAGHVTSLLFRFAPGADAAALEGALLERVTRHVRESVPQEREHGRLFSDFLLAQFDLYLPTIVGGFAIVGLLLLTLVVARGVDRRRRELGLRLALGQRPVHIAGVFAALPMAGTAAGALLGALLHGPIAATTASAWAANMGYPPLVDAGPRWGPVLAASLSCLAVAGLAGALPALVLARGRAARLLHESALGTRRIPGPLARAATRIAAALHLPPPLTLAVAGVVRRRRETLGAIVGVALSTALVLALLAVNVSHRVEAREGLKRTTLDATVHLSEPATEDAVREKAAPLGKAEPFVARAVRLAIDPCLTTRRLVGVSAHGWVETQPLSAGHRFTSDDAAEALVDGWVACKDALKVGDRITLFADPDAPEGVEVRVVGVLDGLSVGRVVVPIGTARRLYGLGTQATGFFVASTLAPDDLERRVTDLGGVEVAYTAARAMAQSDSAFTGSLGVLRLALFTAVLLALVVLGVLALEDARDRAPEVALLQSMGWRGSSLALLAVGEVLARGIPALFLAGVVAAPLAQGFLNRVEAVNGYRVALHVPAWLVAGVLGPGLALLPLAAVPALLTARRTPPARLLRTLVPE